MAGWTCEMPTFRKVFDHIDRTISAAVVKTVDDRAVAEALLNLGKLSRAGMNCAQDVRSGLVHLLSLPSQRDVRRLGTQMAGLRRALAEVEAQLEELKADSQ
jgi:hypothetical protein